MSGSRRRGSRDTSSTETTLLGAAALAATARSSRRRRGKPAFDVRRRRALVTVAILVVLLGGGVAGFATWLSGADEATAEAAPTVQEFTVLGPRYEPTAADRARTPTPITPGTPLVGLTFDDGPTPERTPYVLDVLRAKGARATFFFQGDQVEKHPDIARRALAEGHVVGLHSYEHLYFPELDPQAAREQIVRSEEILTRELGVRPTLWRYPFGEASPAADAVLAERRLVGNVGWDWRSNLPGDFECAGADGLVRLIMTEAKDQAVILLHDGGDAIDCPDPQWEYLPRAIDRLRDRGMEPGVVVPTGRARPLVSVVAP